METDKTLYIRSSSFHIIQNTEQDKQFLKVLDEIPQKIVGLENIPPSELPQYSGEKINPKIIVLMDFRTASGAEKLIGYLYMMNKDNILLVGLNSAGLLASGSSIKYQLPNSKIEISLPSQSFLRTPIYNYIDTFHGETKGFVPDYWTNENNLVETLIYLTGDSKIENLF